MSDKKVKDVKMYYIEDDIEKIQTKTNLYIQQFGPEGAFHLCREVIQNSIDECIRIDQVRAEDIFQKAEKLLEKNDKVDCETLKAKVYESFAIVANL